MKRTVAAGLLGAALSGIPSTTHALATGADPLEGARAAGAMLLPREQRTAPLLAAATVAHLAISLGWAGVLARVLPAGRATPWSVPAALGIAALDFGVIGRRFPRIHALPLLPQLADHVAYGLTVGVVLDRPMTARAAG